MSDIGMACSALVDAMKEAASGVFYSCNPFSFSLGVVISASPLKVKIDQKLTLGEKHRI